MLGGDMREASEGVVTISDIEPPVFRALLHFLYADALPADLRDGGMQPEMAQHLLLAADRYQLGRLRAMCERCLCDSVHVDNVATTLMLADRSRATELRQARFSLPLDRSF